MAHNLVRLMTKVCNKPQLITEDYFDKALSILENRLSNNKELVLVNKSINPREQRLKYDKERKLGIIDIDGALTAVPYYGICGDEGTSHLSIRQQVEQLIDSGAKTIVLDQSSPGGEASYTFETATYIRNLADQNDVKLISYISELSASASYAYSAVSHEVVANPSADAGSIGVLVRLRNSNGYMRNLGIEDIYITAGDGKVPFDSEGKFTQEFLNEVQDSVLELYEEFTSHVSKWRNLEKEKVIALGAKVFSAKKAMEHGLVDSIMELEEFTSYLNTITNGENMTSLTSVLFKEKDKKEMATPDVLELQTQLEKLQTNLQAEIEKFTSQLQARDTAIENLQNLLAQKEEAEAAAKKAVRLTKLASVVGEAEAVELNDTFAELSDTAFDKVFSTLETKYKAIDANLEAEIGDEGEPQTPVTQSYEEAVAERAKKQYSKEGK